MKKKIILLFLHFLFISIVSIAFEEDIFKAAKAGDAAKVESILSANSKLVSARESGMGATALHWAAVFGRKEVIVVLLRFDSDVNLTAKNYGTSMHWAAHHDDAQIIDLLLEKGAKIDHKNKMGRTPLHVAARRGCLTVVKRLIEMGADIQATVKNGNTALHIAAQNGHMDVVEFLLAEGIPETIQNRQGKAYRDVMFNRPHTIELDPQIFETYEGQYALRPGAILKFRKENNRFYYYTFGVDELLPISETTFITSHELKYFTFLKDENGIVNDVIYTSASGKHKAWRLK